MIVQFPQKEKGEVLVSLKREINSRDRRISRVISAITGVNQDDKVFIIKKEKIEENKDANPVL